LNDRNNLQIKQIKNTQVHSHFCLTNYDEIKAYWTSAVFGTFCRNKS